MIYTLIYRAAIDTTETGDFSKATIMSPYIYDHQYARFGEDGMLLYTLGIESRDLVPHNFWCRNVILSIQVCPNILYCVARKFIRQII